MGEKVDDVGANDEKNCLVHLLSLRSVARLGMLLLAKISKETLLIPKGSLSTLWIFLVIDMRYCSSAEQVSYHDKVPFGISVFVGHLLLVLRGLCYALTSRDHDKLHALGMSDGSFSALMIN